MPIHTKSSGDGVELSLTGRVDGAMANELEVAIIEAIRGGAKCLSINLAQASFICSAGLRVLLQYWRQMKTAGKQLVVTEPSPEVDSILAMTGFRDKMVEGAKP
jgi:anti-sigma B factor antagonist